MPTRITEIDASKDTLSVAPVGTEVGTNTERDLTLLKVEGTLHLSDAELLEKICRQISTENQRPVALELTDLCFLDSESAAVLCRMKREQGVRLQGLNLFIKKVVELAEESEKVAKYWPQTESETKRN
jgi:anti-anti-sigma regulatory factor